MHDLERLVLKNCSDLNENVTLFSLTPERIDVYKSRFLEFNPDQRFLIIDEPSPENKDAALIMKNQALECFFEYKTFRYLFLTKVLDHNDYILKKQRLHALKISMPDKLSDGERREYFRVEVAPKNPLSSRFLIYKNGSDTPVSSTILKGQPNWFDGQIHDLSGGGLCLYSKDKAFLLDLEKGDRLELCFRLKAGGEEIKLWAEVRNVRHIENLDVHAWGVRFFETGINPSLKKFRTLIMRYVVDRQREILSR
jgi:c-di-GMP-binding flagellar brake protein YcgR